MEKIALITCNVDKFDHVLEIPKQTVPFDYYYYDASNIMLGGETIRNVSKRLLSKFPKLYSHLLLPDYDIYVWIDGRVHILNNNFIELMIDGLQDLKIAKHPDRQNVAQEFEFIEYQIERGNPYLTQRYTLEGMEEEKNFFPNELSSYPLYASGIFARRNKDYINNAFEEIWDKCVQCGNLDQVLFSLIIEEYQLNVSTVEFYSPYFMLGSHLKEYRKC